jgi:DNA repair protein SbcD/Mre11
LGIRFIHTADIHIGMKFNSASFGGQLSSLRRREIKETFYKIVGRAGEESADLLLIAGDLFENEYVTAGEIKEIISAFAKIKKTKVVIIAGNHDPLVSGSKYDLFDFGENVYVIKDLIKRLEFEDINTDIYATSWAQQYYDESVPLAHVIKDRSRINILLAHGDAYLKRSRYMPFSRDALREKGFDYIALGHIHKQDFMEKNMAYPGSPEPLDFSETGIHGCISGVIDKGRLSVDFIPFSKREFRIVDIGINTEMTYRDIAEKIKEAGNGKDLFRIVLSGTYNRDIDLDEGELLDAVRGDFFFAEIINNAVMDLDIDKIYQDNRDNVIGGFIEEMRKKDLCGSVESNAFRIGLEELLKYRRE